jgi:hypothetical protein
MPKRAILKAHVFYQILKHRLIGISLIMVPVNRPLNSTSKHKAMEIFYTAVVIFNLSLNRTTILVAG